VRELCRDNPNASAFHTLEAWRALVPAAGFDEIEHDYRPPESPRSEEVRPGPFAIALRRRLDAGVRRDAAESTL